MAPQPDSKDIKTALGGSEKDWKRLSKKKNDDGEWVRVFESKKTKEHVAVTEAKEGGFSVQRLTPVANEQFSAAAAAAQEKAADKVIDIIMRYTHRDLEDGAKTDALMAQGYYDVPQKLLAEAGPALAGRFYFAVAEEAGTISTTPMRYFEEKGCMCEDFEVWPIDHLFPDGCTHTQEPYLDINKAFASPLETAKYMQNLGFVWNRNCQDETEPDLTDEIEAGLKKLRPSGKQGPKL